MRHICCLLVVVIVSGCTAEQNANGSAAGASFDQGRDLNLDGRADIFYEQDGPILYELTDKNFDGKIDESMQYSMDTEILMGGKIDENFDGYLETKVIAMNGIVSKVLVDSNSNEIFDMCFQYDHGVLERAFRFYPQHEQTTGSNIGSISFTFGYPLNAEQVEHSLLDEQMFHERVNSDKASDCNL